MTDKKEKVVADLVNRYRVLKMDCMEKSERKIRLYKEKNELQKSIKVAPANTSEILDGVNIFSADQNVVPEQLQGPFNCDESLVFTENEIKILSKGPKYLVREELSKEDFSVEVEKMVAKKKIDNMVNDKEDLPDAVSSHHQRTEPNQNLSSAVSRENSDHAGGGKLSNSEFNSKWEEWSGHMVYNEATKVLDFGNMQASRYKHNKELFLPKIEKIDSESGHQTRRIELERVFDRISNSVSTAERFSKNKLSVKSSPGSKSSPKQNNLESNLTPDEINGLQSLKKRIKDGSIIICETDKSKRFATLSPSQYIESGNVHTKKDIEISPDQIKRLQNHVNDHVWWFNKIMNTGTNWGHDDRMAKNVMDKGEQACHMQLLIKDHKAWSPKSGTPPPHGQLFRVILA